MENIWTQFDNIARIIIATNVPYVLIVSDRNASKTFKED